MKVEQNIMIAWAALLEHGDIGKIAEAANVNYSTISKAVKEGECSETTFVAINDYLAAKKARIEESSNKIID